MALDLVGAVAESILCACSSRFRMPGGAPRIVFRSCSLKPSVCSKQCVGFVPRRDPGTGRETDISEGGPEGALADGLKHLGERDAQRPCQPKQVLEGRIPASGFNPAQVRPVHLGQFARRSWDRPRSPLRYPGCRRWRIYHPDKSVAAPATAPSIAAGIIDVLRWLPSAS